MVRHVESLCSKKWRFRQKFKSKNVLNQLISFDCGEIVLGGDYNLVLEVEKDKIGGNPTTHKKSFKEVLYIANLLGLEDILRIFNPDAKRFTCSFYAQKF